MGIATILTKILVTSWKSVWCNSKQWYSRQSLIYRGNKKKQLQVIALQTWHSSLSVLESAKLLYHIPNWNAKWRNTFTEADHLNIHNTLKCIESHCRMLYLLIQHFQPVRNGYKKKKSHKNSQNMNGRHLLFPSFTKKCIHHFRQS